MELMLISSDGDLLDLWRLEADGNGDCDGSIGRGGGSARGVDMKDGVD